MATVLCSSNFYFLHKPANKKFYQLQIYIQTLENVSLIQGYGYTGW